MWDIVMLLAAFLGGIQFGKVRATNFDISMQTAHMQDLIDEAYEKRDAMRQMWLDAEDKAETWQRRYESLVPVEKE